MLPDLREIPEGTGLSLYVHFPFCRVKCLYCDFYSEAGLRNSSTAPVLSEITAQTGYFLDATGNPALKTIYFGGGTPNIIPQGQLEQFFKQFSSLIPGSPAEWTVEVNPEALTAEQLALFRAYGVRRLSMGVQTFQERLLGLLGRHASVKNVLDALELLKSGWNGGLNLDLISGIPTMTSREAEQDLARLLSFHPDHVSLYTLTVEEGTPLHTLVTRGDLAELPEDLKESLWLDSVHELERAGYRQYETSNFALPGKESLHNLRYWNMLPYAGCGPSAVSTLPGTEGALRIENPRNLVSYLEGRKAFWNADVTALSRTELYFEHLMMGLRLSAGVELQRLKTVFGISPLELLPSVVESWKREGLLSVDDGFLRLSGEGKYLQNRFLVAALEELETNGDRVEELSWP